MQIDNRSIAMRLPSTMAVFVSNYGRIMAFYVYLAPHYLAPPVPILDPPLFQSVLMKAVPR